MNKFIDGNILFLFFDINFKIFLEIPWVSNSLNPD